MISSGSFLRNKIRSIFSIKMSTKVKICGITNLEDAMNATVIGADALGFVFVKDTPRYIALKKASDIIARLPPFLSKVGLFVNPTTDEV
jgi:phosphoribosylanthranilate isomerase